MKSYVNKLNMRNDEKEKATEMNRKLYIRELEGMSRCLWWHCPWWSEEWGRGSNVWGYYMWWREEKRWESYVCRRNQQVSQLRKYTWWTEEKKMQWQSMIKIILCSWEVSGNVIIKHVMLAQILSRCFTWWMWWWQLYSMNSVNSEVERWFTTWSQRNCQMIRVYILNTNWRESTC